MFAARGSVLPVILLCYLALSEGLVVYPRSGKQPELKLFFSADSHWQLPGYRPRLPSIVLDEVKNTGILNIRSWFSKELVSSRNPLTKLPECFQGIGGRSRVFKTTWPIKGAGEAQRVQSIAKVIYGDTFLDKEVAALDKVGQLVDVGYAMSTHYVNLKVWWVIMKDLSVPPYSMAPLHIIIARQLQSGHHALAGVTLDYEGCRELFIRKALDLARVEMKRLVDKHQMLHRDAGLLNVLFSPELTSAEFIDWGVYSTHDTWDDVAKDEFAEAEKMFTDEAKVWCNNFPERFTKLQDQLAI